MSLMTARHEVLEDPRREKRKVLITELLLHVYCYHRENKYKPYLDFTRLKCLAQRCRSYEVGGD